MPLNLTTLTGKVAHIEVGFMGQSTKVTYDPMVLTAENLNAAQSGDDEAFAEFFTRLVKSWDVQKSGKKVPLSAKALAGVPLILLRAIFMAIMDEAGDGESGKDSNGG